MKKIIVFVLSFCVGLFLIVSAYFKLWPIEQFEYKIVGTTFISWQYSVFLARIIIALEFAIGLLMLCSYRLKSTVIITIILLSVFSIHLLFILLEKGNTSDCGCMGSLMELSPLEGLLKNVGLIIICLIIYKLRFNFESKIPYLTFYVFLISLGLVFFVNPIDINYSENYLNRPFDTFELNLDKVYHAKSSEAVESPKIDIRHKKYLLVFLSASCPHCKIAASKLSVISTRNPSIPIYMFINGNKKAIMTFLQKTETSHLPHSMLGRDLFIPLAGLNLPVIYYYNKGKIDKQVDYFTLEQYHIEQWLKKN